MVKQLRYIALLLFLGTQPIQAAPPGKPSPITVAEVISQPLREEILLSGTAEALRESGISSRVDGVVETVFVSEGDWVDADQKILSLDRAIAEIEVASAQARVNEALARHKDARRRKNEYQSLIDRQHVATTSLASAVADEEAARATVARERAELRRRQELLSRHILTAPFSGVLAKKYVEAGQWVTADSAVIKLVAMDTIRIRAPLPQRYYRRLADNSEARIVFDALPGETFTGKVSALVAVGNQSTRSFPIFIDIDNSRHTIAPGMSARMYVELSDSNTQALLIPRDSIVTKADGSRIAWRVAENEGQLKVESVKLVTGRALGDRIEVLESSLKSGDRIVLLGNENLRPGQLVRLTQAD